MRGREPRGWKKKVCQMGVKSVSGSVFGLVDVMMLGRKKFSFVSCTGSHKEHNEKGSSKRGVAPQGPE